MEKITLFFLEKPDVKITMQIYFNEKKQLFFDGHDTGSLIKKTWGNSVYEYNYTIQPEEVTKFYKIFNLKIGDKSALLNAIKKEFSVNKTYSLFGEFMLAHNIKYERFIWP